MRAIYDKEYSGALNEILVVKDENFHHLKNVIRVKDGETVLILNGTGGKSLSTVSKISKREIELTISHVEQVKDSRFLDIAFCLTKKNSFDLALKLAVELGVKSFFPLISDYSQNYILNKQRLNSLTISAALQSNAAYGVEILAKQDLKEFVNSHVKNYYAIHFFDLKESASKQIKAGPIGSELIIIGPEGGFSENERELILASENTIVHHIPVNILRASTALPTAVGYILGQKR